MTAPSSGFLAGGRSHMCGSLRAQHAGQRVDLAGWVARRRDHGGVVFLDLRDREGLVQVVVHPDEAPEAHRIAAEVHTESVVRIHGEVRARPPGTTNPTLPTGDVEVVAASIEVVSVAETPPFTIEDRIDVDEALRLKYRYLDIRRPEMTRALRLRYEAVRSIRSFLHERGFLEVETPMLTRSTPEGARDFLVPSRLQRGAMYALPQSPQLFKQLLMVSGLDRYFQIVRCFRDENPRADRQWEFTQLDVEMSFPTEADVIEVVEAMFVRLMRDVMGEEVNAPFPRLPYREAMARYGSDKPDTRYGMELADVSSIFRESSFQAFSSVVASGGVVKGFAAPGAASWSRRELDGLVQEARSRGAAGLVWLAFEGLQVRSPVEKHLSFAEVESVRKATGAEVGDLVLLVAGQPGRTHVVLDGLRRVMASRLDLVPEGVWNFLWITEMPLFEWGEEEGKWVSMHHPFTSPSSDDLKPETAAARAYDLTLNGWELGGGSIRIHRPEVQERVFGVLGLSHQEVVEKFGFLLEAFRYGVPPHGGIAFGIDRIAMLLAGKDTIRDVIAFPKTQSGIEPMTGAPAPPSVEQLDALGIRFVEADRPV